MSNKNKKSSASFHNSRSNSKASHLSRTKTRDRKIFSTAKRTVLTTIAISMLVVIFAVLVVSFSKPENTVKRKITDIAADYYENYYYPQLIGTAKQDLSLDRIMDSYTKPGFARVTLRQLLLFDNTRYAKAAEIITNYCDENLTSIQIFPEPPFGKTDYRIDYHYSCTF